jgi:DNA-binding transcriptional LysR family regulator
VEAFTKVYERGSFSRAAEELYLSQPTISAHISSLEQELGSLLFDRLGRRILPTPAGEVLYRHALQAFACLDGARHEIRLLQDRVSGELAVGASTIPAHYLLPGVLAGFTSLYPDVRVRLGVGDSDGVARQVAAGDIAVGVVGAVEDIPDLAYTKVLTDDLVVIAPLSLVARNRDMPGSELDKWPWVVREKGSGTRKAFELALAAAGLELRSLKVAVEVESTFAVLQCVKAGLGLSVTSRLAAGSLLERGEVSEVRVPELSFNRSFYCVHHERRSLIPAMRLFIDYMKDYGAKSAA